MYVCDYDYDVKILLNKFNKLTIKSNLYCGYFA